MKLIRYLAAGMLALGLAAAALGVSFFMSGEAASRPAKTFEDYMRDAAAYKNESAYYKAIVSYERALEEQENDPDALIGLAETYGRKMDYDRELEVRKQIVEILPDDIDNRVRIIEIMIRNKEYEAAKKRAEERTRRIEAVENNKKERDNLKDQVNSLSYQLEVKRDDLENLNKEEQEIDKKAIE